MERAFGGWKKGFRGDRVIAPITQGQIFIAQSFQQIGNNGDQKMSRAVRHIFSIPIFLFDIKISKVILSHE